MFDALKFWRYSNAVNNDTFQCSGSSFFISTCLTSTSEITVEKTSLVREFWRRKNCRFLHCNFDGAQMQDLLVIWTLLDFGTQVSLKQLTSIIFSETQSTTFYFFRKTPFEIIVSFSWKGILVKQKCREVLLLLIRLNIQTLVCSLLYQLRFLFMESTDKLFSSRWTICF